MVCRRRKATDFGIISSEPGLKDFKDLLDAFNYQGNL